MLPPGAVPVGGSVKSSGIVASPVLPEAVVPPVPVGWEFSGAVGAVPGRVDVSAVVLAEVVAEVVARVVIPVVITVVVTGGFVVLFLSLPQAKSANESARSANIARIFFIVIS